MSITTNPYKVALNGSAGAFVSIVPKTWCRRMEIVEDDAATEQGIAAQYPQDNFAATFTYSTTREPIVLEKNKTQIGSGALIGYPQQTDAFGNNTGGATVIKLRSATATATTVQVKEYQ